MWSTLLSAFSEHVSVSRLRREVIFEQYLTCTEDGHVLSLTKAGRNAAQRGRTKNNLTQDDKAQQIPPALPCVRLACLHRVQDVAAEKDPDCKTAHKDGDRKRQRHAHREDTTHTCVLHIEDSLHELVPTEFGNRSRSAWRNRKPRGTAQASTELLWVIMLAMTNKVARSRDDKNDQC